MPLNRARARQLLQASDLKTLFIEELGWDRHQTSPVIASVEGVQYTLEAVAEKRGMVAFLAETPNDTEMPNYATRRKIEQQARRAAHEHLIVYTDLERTVQIWQWVRREPGRPAASREHHYNRQQRGDALIQKLEAISFSLDEEEALTITSVAGRFRAFDVDRITRRFYDRFKTEHGVFLKFIKGIQSQGDREWYASLMLNRLMFVYFIQRKGFLDRDLDYLRNRLAETRRTKGKDKFHSFYRYFLLRLFHEGLGQDPRSRASDLDNLLGRVPYLNGGLFDVHALEEQYTKIEIADSAFEKIFDFFDDYQWHLDERPLRADNEINPDVLGYIFEKYINQKQMGAYYTREDITEYMSASTVVPALLDAARLKCRVAFENPKGVTVWDLLRRDPDRYVNEPVRYGTEAPLPPTARFATSSETSSKHVTDGTVETVERRKSWNRPADGHHAVPGETWREVIVRRSRYEKLRSALASGSVRDIHQLITLNLDIRQFAQDILENAEGPELVRAFWSAIDEIKILDPTCGSGAFLFAALNILEPLYEACLDRMEGFVKDLDRANGKSSEERYSDFRQILAQIAAHPNRRYFILKSVVLNNLFGVDLMEEAVEICKLRLFLKLAAQVDPDENAENLGVEPLPDIDFNIKAGNTLVGFASYADAERAITSKLDFSSAMEAIATRAADLQAEYEVFRDSQVDSDGRATREHKLEVRKRLGLLQDELNRYLAAEYGVDPTDTEAYEEWLASHQPFHWFVEFHGILARGGFDAIIGNPPYVVNTPDKVAYEVKRELFKTHSCRNLYALVWERSVQVAHPTASLALIVQLTALSAEKMRPLQDLLLERGLLLASSFPRRPESMFDGVEMPVTIWISRPEPAELYTTRVNRFYTEERPNALALMSFVNHDIRLHGHRVAKVGTPLEVGIIRKLDAAGDVLQTLTTPSGSHLLFYQEACRYWVKASKGIPFFRRNGEEMAPPHGRKLFFDNAKTCAFATCLINSSLFYWFYSAFSDCEHINDALVRTFRVPSSWGAVDWNAHERALARSLKHHSMLKTINTKQGHKIEYEEQDASKSKSLLDEIDTALAEQYGFTQEELDFILNYDIKYRLGPAASEEQGDLASGG